LTEHFSQCGAPILRGKGLQSVREQIRAAFGIVRAEIDITVVGDTEIDGTISLAEVDEEAEVELIELDEEADAEVCIRDAAQAVQQQVAVENHGGVYHISVPLEDAATLIEQALRLV
jgi:hypothetical protein